MYIYIINNVRMNTCMCVQVYVILAYPIHARTQRVGQPMHLKRLQYRPLRLVPD